MGNGYSVRYKQWFITFPLYTGSGVYHIAVNWERGAAFFLIKASGALKMTPCLHPLTCEGYVELRIHSAIRVNGVVPK